MPGITITHGHARGGKVTSEYSTWASMIQRCTNRRNRLYARYGGRGIKVCSRWKKFHAFLRDMGLKPSQRHWLERRNNAKGYSPRNCYWATVSEQQRNRSSNRLLRFDGETMPLIAWAERTGISFRLIWWRLSYGWPIKRALTEPPREGNYRKGSVR